MVKKIIQLSDIHCRTFKMLDEYSETLEVVVNDIKEKVKGLNRDELRIALTGDIFHQKITISNEQIMLVSWFFTELEKIAPLIIICGNHDLVESNKDRVDSITPIIKLLPNLNINYYKGGSDCYVDDNIVWCVYSIFDNNKRPDIESGKLKYGDDKTYVGLFHGPIIGASTDIGYVIEHGYGLEIFEGCDMVLCGDIHKEQKLIYKNIPVVQIGSLIQQNFGETVSSHGYGIWDVKNKDYEKHNIDSNYGFYQFKITSIDDIDNGDEKLINA